MDLKQLEYFVAVVDLGGFSRASRLLGVAQPAISRQVRSLEVELRQSLLLRNGRGALPTEAGKSRAIRRHAQFLQPRQRCQHCHQFGDAAPGQRFPSGQAHLANTQFRRRAE